jgi:bifunctional non-homologous end joining protein LigD
LTLEEYNRKRDFSRTKEPAGKPGASSAKAGATGIFVIQKHRATRLHYDLRLEMGGALKSWAVPKGPSLDPAQRRLAVEVEDHPLDYADFEGVIPEKTYGAGEVIVWDRGTWLYTPSPKDAATPLEGHANGKLHFTLEGEKLRGGFILARSSRQGAKQPTWFLIKAKDDHVVKGGEITERRPESVITGRPVEALRADAPGEEHWLPGKGRVESAPPPVAALDLDAILGEDRAKAVPGALPRELEPMLPSLDEKPPTGAKDRWLNELKLDGIRVLAWKEGPRVRLVSRGGKPLEGSFPDIARSVARLPARDALLDGEICVLDAEGRARFQLIQPRIHVKDAKTVERLAREVPATCYAFDLLHLDGTDLRRVPLIARKRVLKALLPEDERLRYLDHIEGKGAELLALVAERGMEGIVSKRAGSEYAPGRTRSWVKVKCPSFGHFVIGGITIYESTGKGAIGGILLGLYRDGELIYVGGCGTGFDEAKRRELRALLGKRVRATPPFAHFTGLGSSWRSGKKPEEIIWVEPDQACECRYADWTDDGKVRHTAFLGLSDRDPKTCLFPGVPLPDAPLVRRPKLTNLKKVFFPEDGLTKGDLLAYYEMVAPVLLPHLRDRPMVLRRLPDGIHGESFYQKNMGKEAPDWLETVTFHSGESDRDVRYAVVNDLGALLYCIQLGCISLSPWSSRLASIDNPDFSIIDLDPGDDCSFEKVVDVALLVHEILEEIGLRGYPKTSGATGIHVHVPLEPRYTYEDARVLAEIVATIAESRRADLVTVVRSVEARPKDKVYVDFLQNVRGKTVVGPYSVREVARAPVSTPLRWEEVRRDLRPDQFPMATFAGRVEAVGDLWRPVLDDKQRIEDALARLQGKKARSRRS